MSSKHCATNPQSKDEGDHPCAQNGWPKKQIGKGVCTGCIDPTCYKYNRVDRTPKPKEIKKRKEKDFGADKLQELLE